MAAGTRTKAPPSITMLRMGFQWVTPMIRWAGMSSREPRIMSEARLPIRSTRSPAKGAKTMEAAMTMLVMPPAVVNRCVKLKRARCKNPPLPTATSRKCHLLTNMSVERAVKGKMAL